MSFRSRMQAKAKRALDRQKFKPVWVDVVNLLNRSAGRGMTLSGLNLSGPTDVRMQMNRGETGIAVFANNIAQTHFELGIPGDNVKWLVRNGIICHYEGDETESSAHQGYKYWGQSR